MAGAVRLSAHLGGSFYPGAFFRRCVWSQGWVYDLFTVETVRVLRPGAHRLGGRWVAGLRERVGASGGLFSPGRICVARGSGVLLGRWGLACCWPSGGGCICVLAPLYRRSGGCGNSSLVVRLKAWLGGSSAIQVFLQHGRCLFFVRWRASGGCWGGAGCVLRSVRRRRFTPPRIPGGLEGIRNALPNDA